MKRYAALLTLIAVLVPVVAFAGANQGAAILIGTGVWAKTTACATLGMATCVDVIPVNTTAVGANNYAAVYVGREPEGVTMTGIDFGVQYPPAVTVASWNKCGDLEVADPTFPLSGTGTSVVWVAPQTGIVVLVGWFRVTTYLNYGPMTFQLGPNPTFAACRVLDASSNFDDLSNPANGSFDGSPGGNPPCTHGTAVQQTTWGTIKSMYQN